MKPILFHFFDFPVPSFAVMMVLGYVVALFVLYLQVRRATPEERAQGLNAAQVWDLFIVMTVSSILGSKLGHTIFEAPGHITEDGTKIESLWQLLRYDPWHWLRLGESGHVWYGGLIGALLVAVYYFHRRPNLSAPMISDAFAAAITAGAVPGRIGCFLAGCCHGKPSTSAWAVQLPKLPGPVYPTQLFDASVALALTILSFWLFRRRRFDGQVISILLLGYSTFRFVSDVFRGDEDRGRILVLSTSQFLSIPLFLTGLGLYFYLSKRKLAASAPTPVA